MIVAQAECTAKDAFAILIRAAELSGESVEEVSRLVVARKIRFD